MQNYPDGLEAEHVKKLNTDGEKEGGGADIRSFIIGELYFGGEALGKLQEPVEENGSKEFGDLEPQSLSMKLINCKQATKFLLKVFLKDWK